MIVSYRFEIQHLTMMLHEPEVDYDYKTFLYHNRFTRIVKYHDSLRGICLLYWILTL